MQLPPVDRSPQWRPQGADLYSTGASGAVPVRPVHPPNPVESSDRLGQGAIVREPDKPSNTDQANRDWTLPEPEKAKEAKKAEEPPKEPLYKQLVELVQSMWRASAQAVDHAQESSKSEDLLQNKQTARSEPLTYSEPRIKRK